MATIKVYHVQLGDEHFYFGSKKAIFETFGKDVLGITYNSFRNVKDLEHIPFRNKKCIIREGVLVQTRINRVSTNCTDEGED